MIYATQKVLPNIREIEIISYNLSEDSEVRIEIYNRKNYRNNQIHGCERYILKSTVRH